MKTTWYVRLLSYDEAVRVTEYFNKKYEKDGSYGSITVGGISLNGTKKEIHDIIDYLEKNVARYELTLDHPTKVTERIVEDLRKKGEIK